MDAAAGSVDSGLTSLLMMGRFHGIAADEAQLRHDFARIEPFDTPTLLLAAKRIGLSAKLVRQDPQRLDRAPMPAIGIDCSGNFFILAKVDATAAGRRFFIQQPGRAPGLILEEEFFDLWNGELIFFTSRATFQGELARFDFTWFVPAIIKYRRLFGDVLVISLVLQLVGLVTPLFFQVVMDKVLVNHAMTTLNVIAIALIVAVLFEGALTAIRAFLFAHTSSKIDVELGACLFRHLLNLPLGYFEVRRVGDSVARVRELENIRSFLTGNAITLVLDLAFSGVFLLVMLAYSTRLTMVVIGSVPVYFLISLVFTPIIRGRLNEKFNRGADNHSFLVETLGGIDTVKAMAVEPRWIQKWDEQLAAYVTAGLKATNAATLASGGITVTSKLVSALIMWIGAGLVVGNNMTVGELVAFNMLASQVAAPILRLAQLWNDFQQVGVSMSRLGDVLNARAEVVGQKSRLPRVTGSIEFQEVSFRYRADAPDVLRNMTFKIAPGEVIGIVGRSGSGKSTVTKLVQRLYVPDRGRILIDGQDTSVIETASLRRQIGVVLQDSMLFNRSVRDNIALSNPGLSIESVVHAAKLAGAHEFICELPEGYDTRIGEHGAGISGGQRQRIAIARALLTDPRVLIFDEATSAVDYESEKTILENMRIMCQGRTVLIVAHRLSAVRTAARIFVIERGELVETGTHEELLAHKGGAYAHLYHLQQALASGSPGPRVHRPRPNEPQEAALASGG